MALVSLKQLMDDACLHGYAIPPFNLSNMEKMLAIMGAADATDSPVILQASRGARALANDIVLSHLIKAAIALYPHVPVVCIKTMEIRRPHACLPSPTDSVL